MVNEALHVKTKKKKVVSAAVLATSVYTSILFTGGLILGYLGVKYFYDKFIQDDPEKFVFVNIRGWRIHLHHWILGSLVLVYFATIGLHLGDHKIFLGILCGIVAHDIYDTNDWHKIIVKNKELA